ncbi:MAG: hypothetical protein K2L55_01625 [Muribaculaceae bacterium]|nr:hypothetical protein [Muribaculaceae bacterium]
MTYATFYPGTFDEDAEPMWGYSNVSSGAGVVAAQSFATYTLSLKEFLHDALQ